MGSPHGFVHPLLTHPANFEIAASAARTATLTTDDFANHEARGLLISVIVTAIAATPGLTPKMQFSPDDGTTWIDYAAFAALAPAGAANYSLLVYPGIDAAADGSLTESVNLPLPRHWRLVLTAADADSVTYSIRGMYL